MAIDNVQQLLTEQLGKNRCDVITTTAMKEKTTMQFTLLQKAL